MTKLDQQIEDNTRHQLFRLLPSVNDLLLAPVCESLLKTHPHNAVVSSARDCIAELRLGIISGTHTETNLQAMIDELPQMIAAHLALGRRYSLRPVINATGVILHTNLGRAPLSDAALRHLAEVAQGYCNLELDLESGLRSRRDIHAETLVLRVLNKSCANNSDQDRHGVIIVNNCAAATFLALNSLAEKSEVIVSRGELVEIGGGFRIPEIMEKSGAFLKEVGTTNRTHLADYESALGPQTGLLLRVHQSNFSIDGFTEKPSHQELVELAKRTGCGSKTGFLNAVLRGCLRDGYGGHAQYQKGKRGKTHRLLLVPKTLSTPERILRHLRDRCTRTPQRSPLQAELAGKARGKGLF